MKEVFVAHSLNYLKNNNVCNAKQEKIYKYTLESLYSFLTKTFVILILSIILGTFKITLLILIFYSILRGFTFGIHATKNLYCWIISLSVYIFLPFIISKFHFPIHLNYLIYILGLLAILAWSPADTKARPLLDKKKRRNNKYISLLISIFYISLALLTKKQNLKEIVTIILLLNLICICPITYFLFKQPYKNYLFYKK